MQNIHGVHVARTQRAHGALKDPTALPQSSHIALCKRQAAAFISSTTALSFIVNPNMLNNGQGLIIRELKIIY